MLDEEPEETPWFPIVLHLAFAVWFFRNIAKSWRSQPKGGQGIGDTRVTVDQLQPKKSLLSSYIIWGMGGLLGVHHFYLDRFIHGLLALGSLNLCGLGFVMDGFFMPMYTRRFNARCAPSAPVDGSRRTLCCRLPMLVLALWGLVAAAVIFLPRSLHFAGVIDIDRLSAGTEANPYDTLAIPWTASLADAKSAYRRESLRWHPDRNPGCGKECENKMSEIGKAFEAIKRKQAPKPQDKTWEAWASNLVGDWIIVVGAVLQDKT